MNCKGKNRYRKPCGNLALVDSEFCGYHQPKPTILRKSIKKITFVVTIIIILQGLIADLSGTIDVINSLGPQTNILTGVDLMEGGVSNIFNSSTDLSQEMYSGATKRSEYEAVLHLAYQESAGECLALGVSLYNQSNSNDKNIRVKITLPASGQANLEFCEHFDIQVINSFKKDDIIRKFSNLLGTPVANYHITEIGPNEVAFLTIPLKKNENLFLKEADGKIQLIGKPLEINIQTYSDKNQTSIYSVHLYLQKVSDISQALADDGLLWLHHSKYSHRATTNFIKILSRVPFLRKYTGPRYTEYILGFFDKPNVNSMPNYSIVRKPIIKNVVETEKKEDAQLELKQYLSLKNDICLNIVRKEEGIDYPCLVSPRITP